MDKGIANLLGGVYSLLS